MGIYHEVFDTVRERTKGWRPVRLDWVYLAIAARYREPIAFKAYVPGQREEWVAS